MRWTSHDFLRLFVKEWPARLAFRYKILWRFPFDVLLNVLGSFSNWIWHFVSKLLACVSISVAAFRSASSLVFVSNMLVGIGCSFGFQISFGIFVGVHYVSKKICQRVLALLSCDEEGYEGQKMG